MQTKQHTLANEYSFEGKGLHTGTYSHITLKPAPCGTGVVFLRTDLGEGKCVKALAENVSSTARSTTISDGEVSVTTIEHLMSALTGMGVDNAFIEIDNIEVPILDGSALPYAREILKDGTVEQEEDRHLSQSPILSKSKMKSPVHGSGSSLPRSLPPTLPSISTQEFSGSRPLIGTWVRILHPR